MWRRRRRVENGSIRRWGASGCSWLVWYLGFRRLCGSCPCSCGTAHDTDAADREADHMSETDQRAVWVRGIGRRLAHVVDDLVSFPGSDKVDSLRVNSVGLSLGHLIGFLVFNLRRRKHRWVKSFHRKITKCRKVNMKSEPLTSLVFKLFSLTCLMSGVSWGREKPVGMKFLLASLYKIWSGEQNSRVRHRKIKHFHFFISQKRVSVKLIWLHSELNRICFTVTWTWEKTNDRLSNGAPKATLSKVWLAEEI